MSKSFRSAVHATRSLQQKAQRSRNPLVAQQAQIIARLVKNLAQMERGLDDQGRQLTARLGKLAKQARRPPKRGGRKWPGSRPGSGFGSGFGHDAGYYVDMVGRGGGGGRGRKGGKGYRAADTGLVGRRIGRGPVRMASAGGGVSTRALSAAFGRLLAAQAQLQRLKSEMDRVRKQT
jgi:hypothetical protein